MREMFKVLKEAFIKDPKTTFQETLFLIGGGTLIWIALWMAYIIINKI